jgi:hypothetical protein
MKLAVTAFVVLLVGAHLAGDLDRIAGQPLSLFRDGEQARVGYALFALLLLVGGLYNFRLWRSGREAEGLLAGLAGAFLLAVAVTPSLDVIHNLISALLFLMLFAYFGALLYRTNIVAFILHLEVPLALVLATGCHSYGLWQKGFIVYLVLAAAIHEHVLRRGPAAPPPRAWGRAGSDPSLQRRKVYRLDPGRTWARRGAANSSVV